MESLEIARVREELEHFRAGTREPHAALENVVRHGGRAIIGGCPTPVKRERISQAFLGAIAHVWWYEGVKAVGPSRAAIFMNLQPVVGVLLAWVIMREAIEWPEIVGGALVLLGVALTTQAPLAPRAAS
ncbi:MAG: DMT family transporter [Candidatus Rokuibacteriota bacterium]